MRGIWRSATYGSRIITAESISSCADSSQYWKVYILRWIARKQWQDRIWCLHNLLQNKQKWKMALRPSYCTWSVWPSEEPFCKCSPHCQYVYTHTVLETSKDESLGPFFRHSMTRWHDDQPLKSSMTSCSSLHIFIVTATVDASYTTIACSHTLRQWLRSLDHYTVIASTIHPFLQCTVQRFDAHREISNPWLGFPRPPEILNSNANSNHLCFTVTSVRWNFPLTILRWCTPNVGVTSYAMVVFLLKVGGRCDYASFLIVFQGLLHI